jgi:hypothetical protein
VGDHDHGALLRQGVDDEVMRTPTKK